MTAPEEETLTEVFAFRTTYTFACALDAAARRMRRKRSDAVRLMVEWALANMPELKPEETP